MNLVTEYRRQYFLKHVLPAQTRGLEIGPYNQPMVTKAEGDIVYMDYFSREQHIAADPTIEHIADIPEVDIIIHDNDYSKYTSQKFDYIIANHVLEHAPDFIGFLVMLSSMLVDEGILFLALPDKRFSFDKYRSDTSLAHVINDYLAGPEVSLRQHMIEDLLYYDRSFISKPQDIDDRLVRSEIENKYASTPHYGLHCHVFHSDTVVETLLAPLFKIGYVNMDVLDFRPAEGRLGGEMIVMLCKRQFHGAITSERFHVEKVAVR